MRDLPYSNRIEPYLEAISGCDAFFVADRDYGRIINYRQMGADVFPDPATAPDSHTAYLWGLRRQCRGLVFDLAGNVIGPGFEKFMNINECEETQAHMIDLSKPHVICEKLDGSMCRPVPMPEGGYRLFTKMGPTDVAGNAESWVRNNSNYDRFFRDTLAQGFTPLLEWCSRKNRIVVDYPEDRLVLLAIRNVQDGSYMPLGMMLELAGEYGVQVVRRYEGTVHNMEHLMQDTRDLQGQEGWVIWFANGYRVKLKGESYLRIHRAKEMLVRENAVIGLILTESSDDVKSFLPKEDMERLALYETKFWHGINETINAWRTKHLEINITYGDNRKGFALGEATLMDSFLRTALFKAWGNVDFDFHDYIVDVLKKNISTQTKVDAVRHLWGGVYWTPPSLTDD